MSDKRRLSIKRMPALEVLDRRDLLAVVPIPAPPGPLVGPFIPGQPLDLGDNLTPGSGILRGVPFFAGNSNPPPAVVPEPAPPGSLIGPFVPGQPIDFGNNLGPTSGILHGHLPGAPATPSVPAGPTKFSNVDLSKLVSLFMPRQFVFHHAVHHQLHAHRGHR